MRSLHRWISTTAMALLLWVAVTGVLLACLEITVKYLPPLNNNAAAAPFKVDAAAADLPRSEAERLIASSLRAALAAAANTSPVGDSGASSPAGDSEASPYTDIDVQLQMIDGQPRSTVVLNGDLNRRVEIDAYSGALLQPPVVKTQTQILAEATGHSEWQIRFLKMRTRWHVILERLHRGNIIGLSGQVMDILTGLAFVTLSVTGIVMYFQMLGRRKKMGRTDLFWS